MQKHPWKYANVRLVPCLVFATVGWIIASIDGNLRTGRFDHRIAAAIGIIIFLLFASGFLHVITKIVFMLLTTHHLSVGRAAAIKFILRLIGYISIFLMTLDLLGISVARLLLGGAVVGIILGVGEDIVLLSGALGGKYTGRVIDLGLTHTRIKDEDGNIIYMPNATLLSGAAIMSRKRHPKTEEAPHSLS
jgi:small-conductance mechanosensitive channel